MRDLKLSLSQPGSFCDESFIGGDGGSTSLSFFDTNSQRQEFSSIKFNRAEDKASLSQLVISCVASIPFSMHSISCFFELKSSFTRPNSSLRESISLGSDELIWALLPPLPLHSNHGTPDPVSSPPTYLPIQLP